nr:hypothetical protein [Armatimonas sp.]
MTSCRICEHLRTNPDEPGNYWQFFTGEGLRYDLVCPECGRRESNRETVSEDAFRYIEEKGWWNGISGQPEIKRAPSGQSFLHEIVRMEGLDASTVKAVAPQSEGWLALTATGELLELDFALETRRQLALLGQVLNLSLHLGLCVSNDGCFVAAFESRGQKGVVLERVTGKIQLILAHDPDYAEVTPFSLAFFSNLGRTLLVHATDWNRLDVVDPRTGELLTERGRTSYKQGEERPEHYLDYFHGTLYPSSDGAWIADDGWVWHPVGAVNWWSLRRWLQEDVWESEAVQPTPCIRDFWGGPICWVDNTTLAVWGYGDMEKWVLPAIRLFDVPTGRELRWFPGPQTSRDKEAFWEPTVPFHQGWIVYDEVLFACSSEHGVSAWDVVSGTWRFEDASFYPAAYQRSTKTFLTLLPDGAFQLSRLAI